MRRGPAARRVALHTPGCRTNSAGRGKSPRARGASSAARCRRPAGCRTRRWSRARAHAERARFDAETGGCSADRDALEFGYHRGCQAMRQRRIDEVEVRRHSLDIGCACRGIDPDHVVQGGSVKRYASCVLSHAKQVAGALAQAHGAARGAQRLCQRFDATPVFIECRRGGLAHRACTYRGMSPPLRTSCQRFSRRARKAPAVELR